MHDPAGSTDPQRAATAAPRRRAHRLSTALLVALAALVTLLAAQVVAPGRAQADDVVVPTDPDALFAFLAEGGYTAFPAEAEAHPSQGPHGLVRTFVTPALAEAIAAGAETMPVGAAAIKELRGDGDLPNGWAVSVKIDSDSAGGLGWYWYETFDSSGASPPEVAEAGAPLCAGCHAQARDFVISAGPFQSP